jgi:hypothetical protein
MIIRADLRDNLPIAMRLLTGYPVQAATLTKVPETAVSLLRSSHQTARELEGLFQASRTHRAKVLVPELKTAQAEALETIETFKDVMRYKESRTWNTVWAEAGLATDTQTPSSWPERETLLESVAAFVEKRRDLEDASKKFTAAIVLERATALTRAISQMDAHDADHTMLSERREEAKKDLALRIRGFIKELKRELTDDDARWKAFGLESPATERALRPERNLRAESKAKSEAEKRIRKAQEKAAKARQRMEKVKVQVTKLQQAADEAAGRATTPGAGTGSSQITPMAA